MPFLILFVLLVLAIAGGIIISKFLFLILVVAVVVAVLSRVGRRSSS